jgi:hypothetical protein
MLDLPESGELFEEFDEGLRPQNPWSSPIVAGLPNSFAEDYRLPYPAYEFFPAPPLAGRRQPKCSTRRGVVQRQGQLAGRQPMPGQQRDRLAVLIVQRFAVDHEGARCNGG